MSRALTLLFGAIIGLSLGLVAKSLITKVDSATRPSARILVTTSCIIGAILNDLIFSRFSEFELRLCFAVLCSGLLVQSLIDIYTHRLVRQISHIMAVTGVLLLSFNAINNSNSNLLVSAAVCATLGVAISFVSNKISGGSLGAGDVRLMAVLGWHLGFLGYSEAMWALFASCGFAGVFGVAMIVLRRGSLQQRIAFGPFLALGTLTAIFVSEVSSYTFVA